MSDRPWALACGVAAAAPEFALGGASFAHGLVALRAGGGVWLIAGNRLGGGGNTRHHVQRERHEVVLDGLGGRGFDIEILSRGRIGIQTQCPGQLFLMHEGM